MVVENNKNAPAGVALLRLKLVSRIAVFTSLLTAITLALVVFYLSDESGTTYIEVFKAHLTTRQHLGPAMLVSGLTLLALVALISWGIALYSSFRVAGPLYRFAQNLQISSQGLAPVGIRQDDCLQDVSGQLLNSISHLKNHTRQLDELSRQAQQCLQSSDEKAADEYAQLVARLKEMSGQVRVND